MNRIATFTAAALLAAPAAFAEQHMIEDEGMTMMQERLQNALSECQAVLEEEDLMNLTLAQVSGIIVSANSDDSESDKCQKMRAHIED